MPARKRSKKQQQSKNHACDQSGASASPVAVLTVHSQVLDAAIRPILRQIERDLPGVTVDYEIVHPPYSKSPVNDIRLTTSVTFEQAHSSNTARFDALQEEVMIRFLAWYEDWEQMQGLPPTEGGWWRREYYDG